MEIFGIELNKLKYDIFLKNIKTDLISKSKKQNIIFTPNPEILLNTLEDEDFKKILKKASYLTIDWIGLYIAFQINTSSLMSIFKKTPGNLNKFLLFLWNIILLPYFFFNLFFRRRFLYKKYWERICGSDLTNDLVDFSEKENIKITILDPYYPKDFKKVESQRNFRTNLIKKFPKLNFDFFIYNPEKKEEIVKEILESDSKILFSTLWMKAQEKSVIEILKQCPNIKLWLAIGSSFDYFIGFQKRAPKIFRIIWIEWLYRIFTWPQKLKRIKRLYRAIFVFISKALVYKK